MPTLVFQLMVLALLAVIAAAVIVYVRQPKVTDVIREEIERLKEEARQHADVHAILALADQLNDSQVIERLQWYPTRLVAAAMACRATALRADHEDVVKRLRVARSRYAENIADTSTSGRRKKVESLEAMEQDLLRRLVDAEEFLAAFTAHM